MKLYSTPSCPFAQRTRLMLAVKGIDYQLVTVDIRDTPDWFLALSPYGKVPLLLHGDDTVWESAVINEYLEERFPEPPLMPGSPIQRALVRIWVEFANTRLVPAFYKLLLEQQPARQRQLAARLDAELEFIEAEMPAGDGPWWLGAQLTLADLAFYPFFERFPVLAHYRGYRMPASCARLDRWLRRMAERPLVQASREHDAFYIAAYASYADGSINGSTAREMRAAD